MSTIKTAISIDETIFNDVERMSKRLHISRSQFFSQAAKYMIDRKENLELLRKINAACGSITVDNEDPAQRVQEKRYHSKKSADSWK